MKYEAMSQTNVASKLLSILGIALTVNACTDAKQDAYTATPCQPEAAAALVGEIAADDDAIRSMSGGVSLVRRLAPGDIATKDFRVDRLTVHVDEQGRVVSAACN